MSDQDFVDLMLEKAEKKEKDAEPMNQMSSDEVKEVEQITENLRKKLQEQ